jgi:hypothetical protein
MVEILFFHFFSVKSRIVNSAHVLYNIRLFIHDMAWLHTVDVYVIGHFNTISMDLFFLHKAHAMYIQE